MFTYLLRIKKNRKPRKRTRKKISPMGTDGWLLFSSRDD